MRTYIRNCTYRSRAGKAVNTLGHIPMSLERQDLCEGGGVGKGPVASPVPSRATIRRIDGARVKPDDERS